MADIGITLSKGSGGEILVYANYKSGNEPVFIERVNVMEYDSAGDAVGAYTYQLNRSVDPIPGNSLLLSKQPSGTNVKSATAKAYYIEIEETAESKKLTL